MWRIGLVKAWVSILNCIGASDHVLKIVRVFAYILFEHASDGLYD